MQGNGRTYSTPKEIALHLGERLLNRQPAEGDIEDPWGQITPINRAPLSLEITEEETREAILGTGNTSPGSDGITVALLTAAWPHMAKAIHALFLSIVKVGHHPRAFRNAEVVMIPKPGKAPHNEAKKWRPISLLSCIGKGLERLLARRVARTVIAFGIIPSQYFGALPKRSCTDLVACLVHDVEKRSDTTPG